MPPRPLIAVLAAVSLLLIGAAAPSPTQAQQGAVQGRVVDGQTDDPLTGASVALWTVAEGDSTLVTGTTTGPDGRFRIEDVAAEAYTLRISYVGYVDRRIGDVQPAPGGTDLGTIVLRSTTTQAEGVEVTGDRPAAQIETDRTVYDVGQRALNAGGSARSTLENLPSVRIDTDGSISFRGSESVSLYINGDPASLTGESLLGYLQSLPASAVQRIEIIPNPSAKYEPEGTAGIINVVLNRDIDAGWGGGVTLGTKRTANDRYGGNGSVNVNYQSGGWRVVTTYSHDREGEEDSDSRLVRRFNGGAENTIIDQSGFESETERSHSVNTQVNYSPYESTTIGLDATFSLRRDQENGRNLTQWRGAVDSSNARLRANDAGDETIDGRLSVDHDFADDHTLSAELSYDRDFESEEAAYTNRLFLASAAAPQDIGPVRSRETETVNEDEQDGALEIDYSRPLGPVSIETGYKGTYRRLQSDQTYVEPNDRRIRDFVFDEQIHAAYGILSKELGDFTVETGLRAETVNTLIDRTSDTAVESAYTSLYPSAFLTYEPSPRRQMRLSYSKRVDRPNLWDINPIEDNENPSFIERGNPGLDPEYIHSFELSATQRWNVASITLTPYVRHTVNEIEEVEFQRTVNGQTVTVRQARNFASSTSYGTELVTTLNVGDRFEGTLNGNFYRVSTDGSNATSDLSNNALTFDAYTNLRFRVRDGLQLEASQYYRPAHDIPGGRIGRFMSTELALQQQVFSGAGSFTFRVEDVFNATSVNVWRRTDSFYQQSTSQWGAREFSLSFQYTFGTGGGNEGGRDRRDYD